MRDLAEQLDLRTDPTIFFGSATFMVVFVAVLAIAPETIGSPFA